MTMAQPPSPPADAPPNPSQPPGPTFDITIERGDFAEGNYLWLVAQQDRRWADSGYTVTRRGAVRVSRRVARRRAHRLAVDGVIHTEVYSPTVGA